MFEETVDTRTSVVPKLPPALMRKMDLVGLRLRDFSAIGSSCGPGGLLIKVSLSQDGSSSESASLNHEDWKKLALSARCQWN